MSANVSIRAASCSSVGWLYTRVVSSEACPNKVAKPNTALGIGIAAVIYPIFNQTVWHNWEDQPAIGGWKDLGALIALAALLDLMILSENPLLLYPLAVLSGLTVLLILGVCYALILILLFKKENTFNSWRSLWVPLLAGFTVAILQTYLVDIVRYTFTGTWGGFIL